MGRMPKRANVRNPRNHPGWCSFARTTAVVPIALIPEVPPEDAPAPAPARHKRARVSPSQGAVAETTALTFSFSETSGALGPPLLFVVVVCILWTTWLIVLTFAPSWTANYLVDTEGYDDGDFWLIVESEPWIKALSGFGLITVVGCYVRWQTVLLTLLPRVCMSAKWRRHQNKLIASWNDLTGFNGCNRKFWNLWLKCIDLTLQTIALMHMLESGFPSALNYGYTVLLAANASSFDLLFAVMFPIVVLVYCYSTFEFDRELLELNVAVFPAGGFERQARMAANPSELFLFHTSFDSLRIQTPLEFLLRIGMNLSFCNRLKRVVEIQVASRTQLGRSSAMVGDPVCRVWCRGAHVHEQIRDGLDLCVRFVSRVHHTRSTMASSRPVSVPDPRGRGQIATHLINRRLVEFPEPLRRCTNLKHISLLYTEIKTLPAWPDTFGKLEYLHIEGKSGFQNLESLPEDLFAGMPTLAYLHLGVHPHLPKLPSFRGLTNAKHIMLALLFGITEIPSLDPPSKLERLDLVYLSGVPRLPDLAPLRRQLRTLTLYRPNQICCNGFIGGCNLSHPYCAANAPLHIPSDVRCIQDVAPLATTTTTLEIIRANANTVCQNPTLQIPETLTKESIDMCQGVPFRECQRFRDDTVDGGNGTRVPDTGICFNTRMQVLACTLDPLKVTLRKQQILRRVGPVCNPEVEAWLGCTK
ncbi:hypothetical protein FI667_g6788, partial [Globisporangium splendens]